MKINLIKILLLFATSLVNPLGNSIVLAESIVPPPDPTQSIVYWKPHTINPENDADVWLAHDIFNNLLRAWDNSRVEPSLYVVESTNGPWAASLADGNILLSREAINTCLKFGINRANHLLAFILSHELAHQRADDLWHQKFFRLVGNQSPELRKKLLDDLSIDNKNIIGIEQKEAQADHDGLIMMASVGYDPYQIVAKKDFFTSWVENIWSRSCNANTRPDYLNEACSKAQIRALRTRAQLTTVASQATIYELGIQSFIAGKFTQAMQYFTAYGRDYPSRAVYTSLGMTYLAQALQIQEELDLTIHSAKPQFYYPMLLDASPQAEQTNIDKTGVNKRGNNPSLEQKLTRKRDRLITKAIENFEKSMRLEPEHKKTYILMAIAYLVKENTFMSRGVIQGQYIPKFGKDKSAELIIAMTSALEGKSQQALRQFENVNHNLTLKTKTNEALPIALLAYTTYYNHAELLNHLNKKESARGIWENLAADAKRNGSSVLFRLAIQNLGSTLSLNSNVKDHPQIAQLRPGDRLPSRLKNKNAVSNEIWIEGEQLHFYQLENGSKFVVSDEDKIISAWQTQGNETLIGGIKLGDKADRPLKTFGLPDRRLNVIKGEYLAYDNFGLAFHILNNKISGWFLY